MEDITFCFLSLFAIKWPVACPYGVLTSGSACGFYILGGERRGWAAGVDNWKVVP